MATPIIREEVASALRERTAQLQTAYQNVNKLLNEYQLKSQELNQRIRKLGPWELTQQERDKLLTGLKAFPKMAIYITSRSDTDSRNFADGLNEIFKQSGWKSYFSLGGAGGGGGTGAICSWKKGNAEGEEVVNLIKTSVPSTTNQGSIPMQNQPGETVEPIINCIVTEKPLVK